MLVSRETVGLLMLLLVALEGVKNAAKSDLDSEVLSSVMSVTRRWLAT